MKKKTLLSFFVVAVVLLTACVIFIPNAKAATDGIFTYTISNGEATITHCDTSASGALVIPSILGGCPVTSIGEWAFYGCISLTSVEIPDSVKTICNYAFCESDLINVIIGDSVTSIGNSAFSGCTNLTNLEIGNSIRTIGHWAFSGCTNLIKIELPNSVTSIGYRAFYDCNSLKNIKMPDSVKSVGEQAFYNTEYYSTAKNWTGKVLYIGKHLIEARDTETREYTIKEGTKTIAGSAFPNYNNLISIEIPESLMSIGDMAFFDCSSLATVYYSGTEEEWGEISIGWENDRLLSANIIYNYVPNPKVEAIDRAIEGTSLKLGLIGSGEAVIIAPTSKNGKAMTVAELEAIFSGSNVTIESSNGVIGTSCKVTIGEYVVDIAVKGDIDGDGIATVFDALMVKKALANNGFENEALKEFAGDVDGTEVTDSADVDAILAHIVGETLIA